MSSFDFAELQQNMDTAHNFDSTTRRQSSDAPKHHPYIYGWGSNHRGELGLGHSASTKEGATAVRKLSGEKVGEQESMQSACAGACGSAFTILCLRDGRVVACGQNESGQLGMGDGSEVDCTHRFTRIPGQISRFILYLAWECTVLSSYSFMEVFASKDQCMQSCSRGLDKSCSICPELLLFAVKILVGSEQ